MRVVVLVSAAIVLSGCQSRPAPSETAARDYAKECREGKEGACAKACLDVDPSFCQDEIEKRRSTWNKEPKLYWDLLERACNQGHDEPCAELGGMLLGRDPKRALQAYEHACSHADAAGPDCLSERKKWIAEADTARPKCEAGDADACVDLGEAYWAADNGDETIEAFARACEIRGLDNENVLPRLQREICRTGMTYVPSLEHPGERGRCGEEVLYFTPRGFARQTFNTRNQTTPQSTQDPENAPKVVPNGTRKLRLEPVKEVPGYPMDRLATQLADMHGEFEQCASKSPEIKGRIGLYAVFAVDKVGVPAFLEVHQDSHEGGYAPREAWYELQTCLRSVFKDRTYPAPTGNKGVRIGVRFTMNPNAPKIEAPKPGF